MFKNVIAPVQAWLLSQGKCVGCGAELSKAKKQPGGKGSQKVVCKCSRVYVFDDAAKAYRRAKLDEV